MHAARIGRTNALVFVAVLAIWARPAVAAEEHSHPPPEKLGSVAFETSCAPEVKAAFNRAVALLHSFAFDASEQAFRDVARTDPKCAMAHWGIALSYYHPLWEPPDAAHLQQGRAEIDAARALDATPREVAFIEAAAAYYGDSKERSYPDRARAYEQAMGEVAARHPQDDEAQIFHALSLLGTASPTDRTHTKQKQAGQILEPLYRKYPDHPGLAHYLIHAYDSTELASRGLEPARAYSQIAPSVPHALHMPSHIFTRLGLWEDSIASNLAARQAAHEQGDVGEELHAMDYLTYAYLQLGRLDEAKGIARDVAARTSLSAAEFKTGYAANVMPVRVAIEGGDWSGAATLQPLAGSMPQTAAIVYWARAVGRARDNAARTKRRLILRRSTTARRSCRPRATPTGRLRPAFSSRKRARGTPWPRVISRVGSRSCVVPQTRKIRSKSFPLPRAQSFLRGSNWERFCSLPGSPPRRCANLGLRYKLLQDVAVQFWDLNVHKKT